jgi:hypothetical protein
VAWLSATIVQYSPDSRCENGFQSDIEYAVNLGAICDSKADQSSKEIGSRATAAQETDSI